jgi:hypothetical protein
MQWQGGGNSMCGCEHGGVQAVGQSAWSGQYADADANAVQVKPSNGNTPVSIGHSGGGGRSVMQTNAGLAAGFAVNLNETAQSVEQSGGGGGVQAVGQKAGSKQGADAEANAFQLYPSNSNTPVSVGGGEKCGCSGDHGEGSGGDVEQTNLAAALGVAFNANGTGQSVEQSQGASPCKCGGNGIQAVGQSAWNGQYADADADAVQFGPSNSNTPLGSWSSGSGGSVRQTNAALALALAANRNATLQEVTQRQ